MPVLHKYKDREGHYVLTSISKTMVTFQLTAKGEERLLSAGVLDKETFHRGLLLDLYRSGDAYTHGTGSGEGISKADSRQLEFDFKDDPDPESLFPTCANCSSPIGLHLVEVKENGHTASILCVDCRLLKSKAIDTSIPLQLVSRSVLNHILEIKQIKKIDVSVTAFRELLDIQFQAKWDEIAKTKAKKKSVKQEKLFDKSDGKQGKLI
jgi:hypothetical protein